MKNTFKTIIEYGLIIVFVVLIRVFVMTPIEVTGRSMETTLYDDDIMILNILGYRLGGIKRFDIVVIKYNDEHLIKRVIGLPGEKVEYIDNVLYVNGKAVDDVITTGTDDFSTDDLLENGIVPPNKYFVLGDNRGNSTDSRVIGLIDKKDIIGKTNLILYPIKHFKIVK